MNDDHFDRAVMPNFFDAAADPELTFSLILANLMSPRLWELRGRLPQPLQPTREHADRGIRDIQTFVDHHFEHVTPTRVAEINGVLDLDDEVKRLGAADVEYALSKLLSTYDWRIQRGTVKEDERALDLIRQRKFPSYIYTTIDEAWANRRLLQRRKHKPLGVTCCLDEAAIFVALALTMRLASMDDFVFIAAPTHYSVLLWTTETAWWFYSKHDLYSASTWPQLVAEHYAGDVQAAFDDRLRDFDRIITASGTYALATGETSISRTRLAEVAGVIDSFFGARLSQLDHALGREARDIPASQMIRTIQGMASADGARDVQERLRGAALNEEEPVALRALYAFRTLDLPDLRVYLRVARRSIELSERLASIATVEDAIRSVAAIGKSESIFEDPDRIAMPHETARLDTGSDRDKALLLHVLLERALADDYPARASLETLFTTADCFVRSVQFCISIARMACVSQIEGTVLYRIAEF